MNTILNKLVNEPVKDDITYNIMFHNNKACNINWRTGEVSIFKPALMPFSIYFEEADDLDTRVNNLINFYAWCSSRLLSLDREHAKALLNSCALKQASTDKDRAEIALSYKCLSLIDSYWCTCDESDRFEDINLFHNSLSNSFVEVSLYGKSLTVTNSYLVARDLSTMGVAPKAWVRDGGSFLLYKGGSRAMVYNELRASSVLEELGIDAVRYSKSELDGQMVTVSKCFTNEQIGYVTADEITNNYSLSDLIAKYRDEFDISVLVEYLLGNSDMHGGNWGYLFNENREVIGAAPLFDFNHCFESKVDSMSNPYALLGKRVTQLEAAKIAMSNLKWNAAELMKKTNDEFVLERLYLLRGTARVCLNGNVASSSDAIKRLIKGTSPIIGPDLGQERPALNTCCSNDEDENIMVTIEGVTSINNNLGIFKNVFYQYGGARCSIAVQFDAPIPDRKTVIPLSELERYRVHF